MDSDLNFYQNISLLYFQETSFMEVFYFYQVILGDQHFSQHH